MTKCAVPTFTHCGDLFRSGREAEGNAAWATLIEWLMGELPRLDNDMQQRVTTLIPSVIDAHRRRDLLYLADLLEYELSPMFD